MMNPNNNDPSKRNELGGKTIEVSEKQAYYLQRIEVLEELRGKLLAKAKWWFGGILVLIGVGGFVFVDYSINKLLDSELRQIRKATILAEDAATNAREAADQATRQAEVSSGAPVALDKRANSLDVQLLGIRHRIDSETANTRAGGEREMEAIRSQVAELQKLVEKVLTESREDLDAIVKTYQIQLDKIARTARIEKERFSENSKYMVTVFYHPNVKSISEMAVEKLVQAGFKASLENYLVWTKLLPAQPLKGKNEIAYTPLAKEKSKEIQNLLASLPGVGEFALKEISVPRKEPASYGVVKNGVTSYWTDKAGEKWLTVELPMREYIYVYILT